MKIKMLIQMSGSRNGQPWPGLGDVVELPTTEAAFLVSSGIAQEVPDSEELTVHMPEQPADAESENPGPVEVATPPGAETSTPPAPEVTQPPEPETAAPTGKPTAARTATTKPAAAKAARSALVKD